MLKEYEKAIEQLTAVQESIGSMDPTVDKLIETAYLANIDANIKELTNNPTQYESPEEQIKDLQEHRIQYSLKRALERSNTYPNDTQLHYDLALMYFQTENYFLDIREKLLSEFTLKNPLSARCETIASVIGDCNSVSLHVRRGD